MDDFRTILSPPPFPWQLSYETPVLSLGSCFAEHLSRRLAELKFPVLNNPFGILYHPLVIAQALDRLLDGPRYARDSLFEEQDLWRHFDFHSRYAHPDRGAALALINEQLAQGQAFLPRTRLLILTLGTAWGYRLVSDDSLVANCHKLPAGKFRRSRSATGDIVEGLAKVLARCRERQPALRVVITVSPVRHLRDGLVENQRSKAVLLLAAEELAQRLDFVDYFPAYELVLDDLRDYRFYEPDLTHPNELAVDYVWEKFTAACWSSTTRQLAGQVQRLVRAARHRPFHAGTPGHQAFVSQTLEQIASLEKQYPFLDFEEEKQLLNA